MAVWPMSDGLGGELEAIVGSGCPAAELVRTDVAVISVGRVDASIAVMADSDDEAEMSLVLKVVVVGVVVIMVSIVVVVVVVGIADVASTLVFVPELQKTHGLHE